MASSDRAHDHPPQNNQMSPDLTEADEGGGGEIGFIESQIVFFFPAKI